LRIPCQKLRAAAALLIEWFRICLRHGWLKADGLKVRRNDNEVEERMDRGNMLASRLEDLRVRLGLNLPYGSRAIAHASAAPARPVVG
jgi:hypothetical protein